MFKPSFQVSTSDIKKLKRNLREIEPGLQKQFVKDIKAIGREASLPIKKAIRGVKPLSGMIHAGKTAWGVGKPVDSTTVRSKLRSGGRSLNASLVAVRINSAAANIMDMAGRSGKSIGKGKRSSGLTPVVRRTADGGLVAYARRTTVEAGKTFIQNLNTVSGILKRGASRIAWPAVEKDLPQFERRIDGVVSSYYRTTQRKFD